jgi:hypothetical protein
MDDFSLGIFMTDFATNSFRTNDQRRALTGDVRDTYKKKI